jgi:oxygen-independent coproporphyrinogen-3 oxidase
MQASLLQKYNVPVPRYTSYPAVPLWDNNPADSNQWMEHVKASFARNEEISLYIHLPYCESLCTYCGCTKHITKNHLVERPYVNAVLKELKLYTKVLGRKPVLKELHLGGGTPTFFSPANLAFLMEGILAEVDLPKHYNFSFEAHPDSTTVGHLKLLRQFGFNRLSLGVQDFDEELMRVINRFQTLEQVREVTEDARRLGYESINYDLIYGLPKQTPRHIEENLRQLAQLRPDRIAFYSYAHIPDVKKAQRAYSEADLPLGMDKSNLYQQGKTGMERLGYKDIGMDHFALPHDELYVAANSKKLHRNFMGYTPYQTELCLALGASAISDSWTAYAQNEKSVKGYLQQMRQAEQPPLLKTHFLTNEDKRIRRQILDLICHYQTDWLDKPEAFTFALQQSLMQLERDGLVRVFPKQLKVTQQGKSFIRNICRVLDARMDRKQQKLTFSKAV